MYVAIDWLKFSATMLLCRASRWYHPLNRKFQSRHSFLASHFSCLHQEVNQEAQCKEKIYPETLEDAELSCGYCSNRLCTTTDLFLFSWNSSTYLSTISGSILQQLRCDDRNLEVDVNSVSRKKNMVLHCIECDEVIGTIKTVRGATRALIDAKHVGFNIPKGIMPVVSASAYPVESMSFANWDNLLREMKKGNALSQSFGIVLADDSPRNRITLFEKFNHNILASRCISDILTTITSSENCHLATMDNANLATALHRISVHYREAQLFLLNNRSSRKISKMKPIHSLNSTVFSEAPEDQLFQHSLSQEFRTNNEARHECDEIQSERFNNLLVELEKRMESGVYLFSPFHITTIAYSLARIGLARKKLFRSISIGATALIDRFHPQAIASLTWSFASIGLFDHHRNIWHEELFSSIANEISLRRDAFNMNHLSLIAWSFACVQHFDSELFQCIFTSKNLDVTSLRKENKSQLNQAYLALRLEKPELCESIAKNLIPSTLESLRVVNDPIVSSDMHKGLSNTLKRMRIKHVNEYCTSEGYVIDIALVDKKIAMEVNGPIHYNCNSIQLRGSSLMKYRHLEKLGWKVILIPHYEWSHLSTMKMRKEYFLAKFMEEKDKVH